MKITAGIIALNASDTIKYTLESIYNYIDQIIIVEGAVEDYAKVNPDMVNDFHYSCSIDNTPEIIENYENYDDKIEFYDSNNLFKDYFINKSEMQNLILSKIPNNTELFLKIDADEIIDFKNYHTSILEEFFLDPDLVMLKLNAHHFWKDLNHVTIDGQWDQPLAEIIRWNPNLRYSTSKQIKDGFNCLFDLKKMKYIHQCGTVKVFPEKCIFHLAYSHIRPEFVRAKLNYYKHRGIEEKVIDTWSNWKPGEKTSPTHDCGKVVEFKGELPEILKGDILNHPFHYA